ncbi:unnamed protein product [Bursaphelenchus okinawaensis]|uniref:Inosine triphosphate pyrophosphatase n=1 Tax=Bursaphelenchus okinawaensis TaxID=465554 RepID=A0A811KP45_9BILA|nr:unnamed protein product [Bursaphelenchus okinawaensis]CAG9106718.1 unnamed protein product [Bursaphelenchus okinawaensis]
MAAKKSLVFVTSNMKKLAEVKQILSSTFDVTHHKLDLLEIQGTYEEVVKAKAKQAYDQLGIPVIVEDTSLCFKAFKGLPGPYIKYFLESLGPEGLHKMLHAFEDKSAKAVCIFAYCEGAETEPIVFEGICDGQIVSPRYNTAEPFGWDPCFEPLELKKTFGEMSPEEKHKISHRSRALAKLQEYFS